MLHHHLFLILCVLVGLSQEEKWEDLKPAASPREQEAAVRDALERIIPESHTHLFEISVNSSLGSGKPFVHLSSFVKDDDSKSVAINVNGNSGVAVVWGLGEYIKYRLNGHFSWDTVRIEMPNPLPKIPSLIFETHEKFKYWDNVCTFGYSYAFWNWSRWERHIDWMALSGINFPLAFIGQEEIWYRIYKKLGLQDESILSFFSGPAFLPWNRMGNMKTFGGPVSLEFLQKRTYLQHQILNRTRSLGMMTVLPAFSGYVPDDLALLFPNASFSKMGPWNSFPSTTLLDVEDPLFLRIGRLFVREYNKEYGSDHAYNCDVFNELTPHTRDPEYFRNISQRIYEALITEDPDAVWIMQGWLFLNPFWKDPQIKALLTANPKGSMIILDLDSTYREQYTKTKGYYGQPFIFNNLNNYGGALGLFGRSMVINERVFSVRSKYKNLVGIGFTPEGLTDSFAPTELMGEMAWRGNPFSERGLELWYDFYAERRYGVQSSCSSEAWKTLSKSVFNATGDTPQWKTLITGSPYPNKRNVAWYSVVDLVDAWDSMIECIHMSPKYNSSSGFRYDLVDLTRQVIADVSPYWFYQCSHCFKINDSACIHYNSRSFLDILMDLEGVLNTDTRFMLGQWIQDARSWGTSPQESDLFELNARNQVTIWGPRGEILDYAAKQWGGLISEFYIPRFSMYFSQLMKDLASGKNRFDHTKFKEDFLEKVGLPFTRSKAKFPIQPIGDSVRTVLKVYSKWRFVFTPSFLKLVDKKAKRI